MAQIKDLKRMCESYGASCKGCPFYEIDACAAHSLPDNADEIVDDWVKEHPAKTYAMDFFEKFPNAPKRTDGEPKTCIKNIYCGLDIECTAQSCVECWNREMKENG